MKRIAKYLLTGAVVIAAIAASASPSDAAKKKAGSMACKDAGFCSTNCQGNVCSVNICSVSGTWVPAVFTPFCLKANCPAKC